MASILQRLLNVRPVDLAASANASSLRPVLSAGGLMAIGLGSMIGSGIFVLTGVVAANHTGPAITIALLVAALGCTLAALCYAELAAMLPVTGSAYSYAYATMGEGIAWFIGWNLVLEYMMSAAAVAVGWSGYVVNLLSDAGIHLPAALTAAPLAKVSDGNLGFTGALINVPAVLIVGALTWVCYVGIRESSAATNVMVLVKVGVIIVFVLAGLAFIDAQNWTPYIPPNEGRFGHFGWSGVLQGAAIIFFSYIGFDAASTTAMEARNPQRDVPRGILGAVAVSIVLYVGMAAVMTGMVPYSLLDVEAPVAVALDAHPEISWLAVLVKIGAIVGMTSVVLTSLLGQPRILLAMSEDGLMPAAMARCHRLHRTPHVATLITGACAALFAGLFPLDVLGELISIGTLLAFAVVCLGVLVLRRTQADLPRAFRVPFAPVTCVLGFLVCLGMTLALPGDTWWRLLIWTSIGFAIYAVYGYRNSRLRHEP